MNTTTTSNLTHSQLSDIHSLLNACRLHDGINGCISLDSSINAVTDIPCFFMAYENKTLCSVLSIFTPTASECEIYAYTHPEYRQNHLFTNLLTKALTCIRKTPIQNIYLVSEPQSKPAIKTADALNVTICYSEYMLSYNMDIIPAPKHILDMDCEKQDDIETIHLSHNGIPVAMCRTYMNNNYASIFDFEVAEKYRGKGYGKESLLTLIEYLINNKATSITLNVNSTNKKAHKLYTAHGFFIKEQINYYSLF